MVSALKGIVDANLTARLRCAVLELDRDERGTGTPPEIFASRPCRQSTAVRLQHPPSYPRPRHRNRLHFRPGVARPDSTPGSPPAISLVQVVFDRWLHRLPRNSSSWPFVFIRSRFFFSTTTRLRPGGMMTRRFVFPRAPLGVHRGGGGIGGGHAAMVRYLPKLDTMARLVHRRPMGNFRQPQECPRPLGPLSSVVAEPHSLASRSFLISGGI